MPRNRWLLAVACLRIACVCQGVVGGDPDSGAAVQVDAGGTVTTADASTATDAGQDAGPAVTGTDAGRTIPVGMPSPGCADAGDPTLTADERLLLNLPEDSWFEVPSSHLYETCKNASTFGDGVYLVQGCAGLINSWSSGLYDPERQRMVVWGGGHNDYGGNELYAFNLKTFTWQQLTKPSRPPFDKDPLDDGNPVSRHTYDGFEFISHRGTYFGWGGARSTSGNGTDVTWEFMLDGGWSHLDPPSAPASGSGLYSFGLAYDPMSRQVFVHLLAWFGSYDFATNRWVRKFDFGYPPYTQLYDVGGPRTGAMHLGQGLFVSIGTGAPALVYSVDAGTVVSLTAPWNDLSNHPSLAKPAPGLEYDLTTRQLVAWSGGAPVVLDTDTVPYRWVARSGVGAPADQSGNGTYGRWRYVERYNVFVLVNDASQNVFFYKHTPRCGQ